MSDAAALRERGGRRRRHEPSIVYVLTTPGPDGHQHCAALDDDGDGQTGFSSGDGHRHAVVALDVAPGADGHTHELGTQRCWRVHPLAEPCER